MSKLLATFLLIGGIWYVGTWLNGGVFLGPTATPSQWWGLSIDASPVAIATQQKVSSSGIGSALTPFSEKPLRAVVSVIDGSTGRTSPRSNFIGGTPFDD